MMMHVNVFTYPYISRIRIMAILHQQWHLVLVWQRVYEKKTELKPDLLRLKIDLVSYLAFNEGVGHIYSCQNIRNEIKITFLVTNISSQ